MRGLINITLSNVKYMPKISFIIPTIRRPSLQNTIMSVPQREGDEIHVIEDYPPTNMWGNPQRNKGIELSTGDYLSFMDDDDIYVPNAREIIDKVITDYPNRPVLFKVRYPDGNEIWKKKRIIPGNITTQMILIPNQKDMFLPWKDGRNMADFIFVDTWKWKDEDIVWSEEVICLMGHNDGAKL